MEPYEKLQDRPLCVKGDVVAELVVVFGNKREDRGLKLIAPFTRAIRLHEIHEFIITDEENVRPGTTANRVAYLCYAEIKRGGAIMFGDKAVIGGKVIGEVVGFDETHMPNHINVILHSREFKSGFELGLSVGQQMVITGKV
ncbi:MAG: hypothetical protein QME90_04585 [Thermodesulfobacteriota bacterium]|nr:hypothetical protein [Thermodesulfobacteriota bacterium]